MKALFYTISLILSLPNLLIGLALAVLQHTFVSRNPLQILLQFLEAVVWGLPAAAVVLLVLLVAGFFLTTRPYAALLALVLNGIALALVLRHIGLPTDAYEAACYVPVFMATIGFAAVTYLDFTADRAPITLEP